MIFTGQSSYSGLVLLAIICAAFPFAIALCTSYMKVSIVLSFLRNGLGAGNVPGNMLTLGLSLCLTALIMEDPIEESWKNVQANLAAEKEEKKNDGASSVDAQIKLFLQALEPFAKFLEQHTGTQERERVIAFAKRQDIARGEKAQGKKQEKDQTRRLSSAQLVLAFLLTELKEAFLMGFTLLLPFLVIDFIVAHLLAALNMVMLSPTLVSLPIKIFLFVLTDAWTIVIESLLGSYQGGW